jgi:hypothetical protein
VGVCWDRAHWKGGPQADLVVCAPLRERECVCEREIEIGKSPGLPLFLDSTVLSKNATPLKPYVRLEGCNAALKSSVIRNPDHIQFPQTRSDHQ